MSDTANADQIAYWNGRSGLKWAEDREKLDAMMQPIADAALAAAVATPGESVIDLGCGTGATAIALADLAGPEGRVLGVDVSRPMLEVARSRIGARRNVKFLEADAATASFEPGSADLIFSKFGVMFFADPEAAFRNIHRAARAGGRLAFVCWRSMQENPFAMLPIGAALKHLPPQPKPDPTAPGPFAFADPVRVGHILMQAGFKTPAFAAFDTKMVVGSDPASAARDAAMVGMASRLLAEASEAQREGAIADLTETYAQHMTAEGVALDAHCWVVTASA